MVWEISVADEVVRLYFEEQRGLKYISEHLGISYNTAKSRLYRSDTYRAYKKGNLSVAKRVFEQVEQGRLYTPEELLAEHGYDPDKWRAKSSTSNNWGKVDEQGKMQYQHKISVVPKELAPTPEELTEKLNAIQPQIVDLVIDEVLTQYLCIPLYDLHFDGYEQHLELLENIVDYVRNGYEEILIIIGGDFLHVDNFNNTTVKGTRIDDVNFEGMITDAIQFLTDLFVECLENCPNVKVVYLTGNHASSNDYLLMRGMEMKFPQIEMDLQIEEYKHGWLGNHSIFMHHGDKRNNKPLLEIMVSKYAKEWGESQSRYLITGHYHHEKSLSTAGMTHYQVMSPANLSSYDKKMGYITSEQGVMLFEFNNERRKAIYYI